MNDYSIVGNCGDKRVCLLEPYYSMGELSTEIKASSGQATDQKIAKKKRSEIKQYNRFKLKF